MYYLTELYFLLRLVISFRLYYFVYIFFMLKNIYFEMNRDKYQKSKFSMISFSFLPIISTPKLKKNSIKIYFCNNQVAWTGEHNKNLNNTNIIPRKPRIILCD